MPEVTVGTGLGVIRTTPKVFFQNLMDCIIKRSHRSIYRTLRIRKTDHGIAIFLSRIVHVHLAYLLAGSLLYQIGIDVQLPSIVLQSISHFFYVPISHFSGKFFNNLDAFNIIFCFFVFFSVHVFLRPFYYYLQ